MVISNMPDIFCNNNTVPSWPNQRNVLSLHVSDDLICWHHRKTLLEDDLNLPLEESLRQIGFQYVDWQFDGIVRIAYNGAHNFHDANRITFHALESFRSIL